MKNLHEDQSIVPYFMVLNAPKFIHFTRKAFQAELGTVEKLEGTEGVIHAEMKIGGSTIYFADTSADGSCGPGVCGDLNNDGLVPIQMYIYVDDAAETHEKATAAGGTSIMEVTEENGHMGGIVDPLGNLWWIQTKNK
ncbi:VOC family protein [Evansella halocellulosilytica]|uniref:VOC family protein n=1 Tax=Evansella halocellulosilytica TaxID=2011013 RepID=UPI000BB836AB|nr:VOC family protein [Evansella halocellulosilytica]